MKVKINTEKCVACGQCVIVAPDIFELKDIEGEMKAHVKKDIDLEGNKEAVLSAEEECPASAILVEEDKCGVKEEER